MVKKIVSLILISALIISMITVTHFTATALTSEDQGSKSDFSYSVLQDGTLKLTNYTGTKTEITIPAIIDGKRVSTIGNSCFYIDYGKTGIITSITSIDIPEGITKIESGAFVRCTSLKTVIFPHTLQSVSQYAFFDMGFGTKNVLYCGSKEELKAILQGKICDSYSTVVISYEYTRTNLSSLETFVMYDNHYYMVFDKSISWNSAKLECENLGGHLVTINSEEEQAFITDLVKSSSKNNMWIGAYLDNGVYKWITAEPFLYTNWATDEPNNVFNMQNAVMMYTQNAAFPAGTWNDENENGRSWPGYYLSDFGLICEWDFDDYKNIDVFSYYSNGDGTCSVYDYVGTDKNVVIPEIIDGLTVTKIADRTFGNISLTDDVGISDCDILSVTIPKTVVDIGDSVFINCSSLKSIIVDKENTEYKSVDGILYTADDTTLICYPALRENNVLTLSKNLKVYSDYAFYNVTENSLSKIIYASNSFDYAMINKGKGNSITSRVLKIYQTDSNYENHWNFQNLGVEITIDQYTDVFGKNKGEQLYNLATSDADCNKHTNGVNGICYGMVLSSGIIESSSIFNSNTLFGLKNLFSVNQTDSCKFTSVDTALDLIKFCHLYQLSKENAEAKVSNTGDFIGMIEAVKQYQNGYSNPIVINIGPHAVLAESVKANNDGGWDIEVYDSNFVTTSNTLSIYKDNNIYKWKMLFWEPSADSEEIKELMFEGTEKDIYYFEVNDSVINRIVNKEQFSTPNFLLNSKINKMENHTFEVPRVSGILPNSDITEYDNSSTGLYWVETDNGTLEMTILEDDDTFGLYGNNSEFSGSMIKNTGLSFSVNNGEINTIDISNNNYIDVKFEDEKGNIISIFGDDNDGSLSVGITDNGFVIDSVDKETKITVVDSIGEVLLTQSIIIDSKSIIVDLTGENIKYDINGDGNYTSKVESYSIGDVNNDGDVTIADATTLQKYLANIVDFDDKQLAVADTNCDGSVSIADATHIQKYLANIVTSLGKI